MKISIILTAALTLALSTAAFAYPSLSGPTGGTNQPNAMVPAVDTGQFAADYSMRNHDNELIVRGVLGIATNFEVGAAGYIDTSSGGGDNNAFGLNAKYVLADLNLQPTDKVAVGINYQKASGSFDSTSIYAVGSRQFKMLEENQPAILGSVGLDFDSASNTTIRPFIGVDVVFRDGLTINGELKAKGSDDAAAMYALTARYPINSTWTAQFGLTNSWLGNFGGNDGGVTIGAAYSFDKKK